VSVSVSPSVTVISVATVLAESVLVLMVLLEEVEVVLLPIITTFGTGCCGGWCFLLPRLPPVDLK